MYDAYFNIHTTLFTFALIMMHNIQHVMHAAQAGIRQHAELSGGLRGRPGRRHVAGSRPSPAASFQTYDPKTTTTDPLSKTSNIQRHDQVDALKPWYDMIMTNDTCNEDGDDVDVIVIV